MVEPWNIQTLSYFLSNRVKVGFVIFNHRRLKLILTIRDHNKKFQHIQIPTNYYIMANYKLINKTEKQFRTYLASSSFVSLFLFILELGRKKSVIFVDVDALLSINFLCLSFLNAAPDFFFASISNCSQNSKSIINIQPPRIIKINYNIKNTIKGREIIRYCFRHPSHTSVSSFRLFLINIYI